LVIIDWKDFSQHRNLSPLLPASVVAELRLGEAPFVDFLFSGLPELYGKQQLSQAPQNYPFILFFPRRHLDVKYVPMTSLGAMPVVPKAPVMPTRNGPSLAPAFCGVICGAGPGYYEILLVFVFSHTAKI
jgi:hypothetical protein